MELYQNNCNQLYHSWKRTVWETQQLLSQSHSEIPLSRCGLHTLWMWNFDWATIPFPGSSLTHCSHNSWAFFFSHYSSWPYLEWAFKICLSWVSKSFPTQYTSNDQCLGPKFLKFCTFTVSTPVSVVSWWLVSWYNWKNRFLIYFILVSLHALIGTLTGFF